MGTMDDVEERVRAAGFASVEAAERALKNLRRRRESAIERRIGASSMGDSDFGGGIPIQQWQSLNSAIDKANELPALEAEIRRIESLLA